MGSKVLGRITTSNDRPRGPDVLMGLSVPEAWFSDGATVAIELPRNLVCAECEGGGCDKCHRSGAASTRGRKDPKETVEVTLPRPSPSDDVPSTAARVVVLRIPERGGLSTDPELPRGNLMLSLRSGGEPPPGVRRLARPSLPPSTEPELVSTSIAPRVTRAEARRRLLPWVAAAVVMLVILWRWLR